MKIATDFDVAKWLKERTWLYSFDLVNLKKTPFEDISIERYTEIH